MFTQFPILFLNPLWYLSQNLESNCLIQSWSYQCFSISVHHPYEATCAAASSPSSNSNSDLNPDLEGVPHFYHKFSDVFSKKKADTLSPHQDCDLKIEIDETAKPPLGPIYSLSQSELTALQEFIDENVANGFIQPSNSPFRAPVLFVKKKDGSVLTSVDSMLLPGKTSTLYH